MRRKSIASVWRATSVMAPAISTPVAPAPTITKVNRRARSLASVAISARSKAISSRRRMRVASSMRFKPGAASAHSSWPK